jgi:hypothetical protein
MGLLTRDVERRILKWVLVDQLDTSIVLTHPIVVRLMGTNGDATNAGVEIIGDTYVEAESEWTESTTTPGVEFVNAIDISYNSLSSANSVSVAGAELWDSSEPAVRVGYATFTSPVIVATGQPFTVGAGQLKVHLT